MQGCAQGRLTKDDFSIEVVHKALHKLGFDGSLVGQHAQVMRQLGMLSDDDALP